jgi:radical SAM superfamily enzyme YgiQ (UPF0313 family)
MVNTYIVCPEEREAVSLSDKSQVPWRITTKLVVKFGAEGVLMVAPSMVSPMILNYYHLLAISELDTNDHTDSATLAVKISLLCGVEKKDVKQFFHSLVNGGRLRRQERAIPVGLLPPSTVSVHPELRKLSPGLIALKVPLALRLCRGEYQLIDHSGCLLLSLNAAEVIAVGQFVGYSDFVTGLRKQQQLLGSAAVDDARLITILALLENAGFLSNIDAAKQCEVVAPQQLTRDQAKKASFARQAAELDALEAKRQQHTGVVRPQIIPCSVDECVPAALGLMFAYAKAYGDGGLDEFYDFRLDWYWDEDRLESFTSHPAIYLYSNYLWSHEKSIAVSEIVKRLSPDSITIHGGPDTPKYSQDAERYFEAYPHVDIIIRGEGEASCAETLDKLRSVIGQENPNLSVLEGVEGISYRHNGRIVRNPDRDRIGNLDTIPSPYLAGLFDAFKNIPRLHVTLETNRGCPYGCTFCDWGSATLSKIRKFDLDRVYRELEWCSQAKIQSVSVADANFGVFERDVSIAQRVGDLKQKTGYPAAFGGSFAKNSTKYLQKIIKIMAEADIWTQGVLSLQTMDDDTLSVIKRTNIKVAKYDALANEMRDANLQLSVELMMALPGSTLQSFIEDLQQCIDRDIQARINDTTMLVNSPMNAPEYREEHQIETGTEVGPGNTPILASSKSFTRKDRHDMVVIRDLYILLDNFGVLRLCSSFVRQQTGMREIDFYQMLLSRVGGPSEEVKWPILNTLVNSGKYLMAPPYSWALMIDELRRYLVSEMGVPDNSVLDAVMIVQHALLPAFGRTYPLSLELQHDVVEWHNQILTAKAAGHWQDWHTIVPPLSSFGLGRMVIDDVDGCVTSVLGCDLLLSGSGINWDMDSGIGRARVSQGFDPAWEPEAALAS